MISIGFDYLQNFIFLVIEIINWSTVMKVVTNKASSRQE